MATNSPKGCVVLGILSYVVDTDGIFKTNGTSFYMLFRKCHIPLKIYIGGILIYQLLGIILMVAQEFQSTVVLIFLILSLFG